ncbi:uncharacterized protein MONBRDRAFT_27956 [Monosiga brevicollis MX1]|uniref:Uncharacterized protein n=1 Tax=Monosiga brevicollis TaxID=81824 RepID=A9V6I4_MONBE|nr:uncharacterized protein MONBRDRAFT_27956 [Monosiga brevicollis MX1]EDQ86890.1 predicted protein [Monosiga brevicollis MX1]|eukprot:XP_001748435.1 hypothetical protein [Monosiga brevicollis MX1]
METIAQLQAHIRQTQLNQTQPTAAAASSGALTAELASRLQAVERRLTTAESENMMRHNEQQRRLDQVGSTQTDLRSAWRRHDESLTQLQLQSNTTAASVATQIRQALTVMHDKIDRQAVIQEQLQANVLQLHETMVEQQQRADQRQDTLNKHIESLTAGTHLLQENQAHTHTRTNALDARCAQLETGFQDAHDNLREHVQEGLTDTRRQLDAVSEQLRHMTALQSGDLQTVMNDLQHMQGHQQAAIDEVRQALQTEIDDVRGALATQRDAQRQQLQAAQGDVQALVAAQLTAHQKTLASELKRVDDALSRATSSAAGELQKLNRNITAVADTTGQRLHQTEAVLQAEILSRQRLQGAVESQRRTGHDDLRQAADALRAEWDERLQAQAVKSRDYVERRSQDLRVAIDQAQRASQDLAAQIQALQANAKILERAQGAKVELLARTVTRHQEDAAQGRQTLERHLELIRRSLGAKVDQTAFDAKSTALRAEMQAWTEQHNQDGQSLAQRIEQLSRQQDVHLQHAMLGLKDEMTYVKDVMAQLQVRTQAVALAQDAQRLGLATTSDSPTPLEPEPHHSAALQVLTPVAPATPPPGAPRRSSRGHLASRGSSGGIRSRSVSPPLAASQPTSDAITPTVLVEDADGQDEMEDMSKDMPLDPVIQPLTAAHRKEELAEDSQSGLSVVLEEDEEPEDDEAELDQTTTETPDDEGKEASDRRIEAFDEPEARASDAGDESPDAEGDETPKDGSDELPDSDGEREELNNDDGRARNDVKHNESHQEVD